MFTVKVECASLGSLLTRIRASKSAGRNNATMQRNANSRILKNELNKLEPKKIDQANL